MIIISRQVVYTDLAKEFFIFPTEICKKEILTNLMFRSCIRNCRSGNNCFMYVVLSYLYRPLRHRRRVEVKIHEC